MSRPYECPAGEPRAPLKRPAGEPRAPLKCPAGEPRARLKRPAGEPRAPLKRPAGEPRAFIWAVSLLCLAVACGGTQEPDPEVPTAEPSATAAKPKREKPKCLAFTENCLATADTQAKIPGSEAVFIPPAGWAYAQTSDATLTQIEGSPAVIALAGFDSAPADEAKTRDSLYAKLLELLELSPPEKFKKKYAPKWEKADQERENGSMKIKLWQAEAAKRSGKSGFLLVLMTTDPAGKKIVGVAFSPDGDDASIEKISTALETIGPGSYQ